MQRHNSNIKQLLIDFITGEIDPTNKKVVKDWINQSPENKTYFHHLRDVWESSGAVKSNSTIPTEKSLQRVQKRMHKNQIHRNVFQRFSRIAALFLVAFAFGFLVDYLFSPFEKSTSAQFNITETPRGSRSKVVLADGTLVWLNADSKLKYPVQFSEKERLVELEGEGFFEVKENKKKPFVVRASGINIKALGTSFNVKAYKDEGTIETTLVEGLVAIKKETEKEEVLLKPNQKATFYKEKNTSVIQNLSANKETESTNIKLPDKTENIKGKIVVDKDIETKVNTSWKDNQWIIRNKTLEDLAVEIERKYDVVIDFNSESLKQYRYSGTLEDEPLEQVLTLMSLTSPLTYSIEGKKVTFNEDSMTKEKYKNVYRK